MEELEKDLVEEVIEEKAEPINNVKQEVLNLPWQFSTVGLILGVFLGVIPFVLSLYGNYLMKKGLPVAEIKKAYNIILIVMVVLVGLFLIMWIGILIASIGRVAYY